MDKLQTIPLMKYPQDMGLGDDFQTVQEKHEQVCLCWCFKARFYYERGKDYSLFVLLILFALLSACFNFKRGKINKRNKESSFPRS